MVQFIGQIDQFRFQASKLGTLHPDFQELPAGGINCEYMAAVNVKFSGIVRLYLL
jgi:hypothetical protein